MAAKPPEAVRFSAQLANARALLRAQLDQVVQGAAFIVWEGITVGNRYGPGTPVDTGFARNSWWANAGQSPSAGTHPNPPATPVKGQRLAPNGDLASLAILGATAGSVLTFSNGAAYAEALELGHSRQAPAGFVRVVAAQWPSIVTDVARTLSASGGAA